MKLSLTRWLPVILWMAIIFAVSASSNPIAALPGPIKREVTRDLPQVYDLNLGWRPLTPNEIFHPLEFTVLALLLVRAFHQPPLPLRLILARTLALAALYALLDELHQIWVPVRTFQLSDLVLDLIGILLGLGLAALYLKFFLPLLKKRPRTI